MEEFNWSIFMSLEFEKINECDLFYLDTNGYIAYLILDKRIKLCYMDIKNRRQGEGRRLFNKFLEFIPDDIQEIILESLEQSVEFWSKMCFTIDNKALSTYYMSRRLK
jgi:hypothetical protein